MNKSKYPVCLVLAVTLFACSSSIREDQLLTEVANMNKQEVYDKAEALFTKGAMTESRKYFSFVYDTFPNDPLGHKAALRVADTYASKKDTGSLTEARLRYRDFANRYPNDPDRDYALLMVGQTYSARQMKADRDLSTLQEALQAYQQLITLYPNSPYREEAEKRILQLREVLAEHEFITAQFYFRNKRWLASQWRIEYLKEHYPEYSNMAEADEILEESLRRVGEAQAKMQKLIEERRLAEEAKQQEGEGGDGPSEGGESSKSGG